jgi:hypothetical protein
VRLQIYANKQFIRMAWGEGEHASAPRSFRGAFGLCLSGPDYSHMNP